MQMKGDSPWTPHVQLINVSILCPSQQQEAREKSAAVEGIWANKEEHLGTSRSQNCCLKISLFSEINGHQKKENFPIFRDIFFLLSLSTLQLNKVLSNDRGGTPARILGTWGSPRTSAVYVLPPQRQQFSDYCPSTHWLIGPSVPNIFLLPLLITTLHLRNTCNSHI